MYTHTHLSCYIYTIAHVRKLHTQAPVNLEFANRKLKHCITLTKLECGPMLNVMVALPNTGGALCSTSQSLADAGYYTVNPKGVGVHPQGWSILHTLGCKYAPSPKGV